MITKDQLDILKDIFSECDEEWLLTHLSIVNTGYRDFSITIDNANSQDWEELFQSDTTKQEGV